MFSWLQPWSTTIKIPQQKQQQQQNVAQRSLFNHVHLSSTSLPLSEKVMISPKSIAIAKKTAVHVSGDDNSSIYHQQHNNSSLDPSPMTTSSAASIALSVELAKKQQKLGLTESTISAKPIDPLSSNTSISSTKSLSSSPISISPPKHQAQQAASTPPLPAPALEKRPSSTTTRASTSTSTCSARPPPPVMHPSPKRTATRFSTSVSANGDIAFETHIMAPQSPTLASSSSGISTTNNSKQDQQQQQHESPTENVSMISVSLAEKHLMDMIQPLPPPMSASSSTLTTDATDESPDLQQPEQHHHHQKQKQKQQHGQTQKQKKQDLAATSSLSPDQVIVTNKGTANHLGDDNTNTTDVDQQNQLQPPVPQQLDQKVEAQTIQQGRKGGVWSWLLLSPPPSRTPPPPPRSSTSTNQNQALTPAVGAAPVADCATTANENHSLQHPHQDLDRKEAIIENDNNNNASSHRSHSSDSASPSTFHSVASVKPSSSSVVSPGTTPNKKGLRINHVLPSFRSQYHVPFPSTTSPSSATLPSPPTSAGQPGGGATKPGNLFDKAMESINQFIQQASTSISNKTNDRIILTDPDSWRQQMKARFARFIDDMKSDPHGLADKRIVIIGVHGWFPAKLVRSMIGEPTGTSTKFCEQMVAAVKKYFEQEHGLFLADDDDATTTITSIPLEGEGKVEDRVNKLYTKLINHSTWLEAVSSADVILWATHSQGTPVSAMLLHRLLERGHIHTHRQSVGMLAMAGISHGPFPVLKGSLIVKYFEADAARELFEFMDSESDISKKFRTSLAYIMQRGIKLTLVGSMQDQVVPLYSAIISAISHPNIVRSVYIDGHIFTQENDFIINLITFALGLRNAGLSDHGLLTHLSEVLAGSLYALEGGHSTIYEELDVYYLAVQHLFETDPLGKAELIHRNDTLSAPSGNGGSSNTMTTNDSTLLRPFQAKAIKNPYYLPWAMRGICEDQAILKNSTWAKQLDELRHSFDNWEPTTPKLRSVKIRLEPFTLPLL